MRGRGATSARPAPVDEVMRRLASAIDGLAVPTVEKIAREKTEDPFRVLIATMLSAQTRDTVTEEACRRLFRMVRTPRTLATLPVRSIRRLIYPVSFYRTKARHVQETCRLLVSRHGGEVPATMEALVALPGVGRKTANLVLILGHRSRDNICVDTHVHRIANRLAWARTKTPEQTEMALYEATRRRWWPIVNRYLVTWGQNVCRPVYPLCGACALNDICPRTGVTKVGRSVTSDEVTRDEGRRTRDEGRVRGGESH